MNAYTERGTIKKKEKKKAQWLDVIEDHSLLLVQVLLQSIQEKAETLMTEVINPTREKREQTNQKNQSPNIQSELLLPCWFIVSHVDSQTEANTNNIALSSEEISHSD